MSGDEGCVFSIKVVPNASRTEIAGWLGDTLKVRVQAPPEDGKANQALVGFLSQTLHCDRGQIVLESGGFSPRKRLRFIGLNRSWIITKLGIKDQHG